MIPVIDYRKKRFYSKELHGICRSNTNREGEGILIGHQQMGELEIPLDRAEEIFVSFLREHGWMVERNAA